VARSALARSSAATLLAVCACVASWGCIVSFGGLTGGGGEEDASRDGTTDGKSPPRDGGPRDGKLDRDGGNDTSPSEAACVPVDPGDAAPKACPAIDASCAPLPRSGFMPVYVPPRATLSVCTTAQIATYTNNCFSGGDASTCSAFEDDSANASCIGCLIGPASTTETVWGPILVASDLLELDIGGCIALTDPCQTACGAALEAQLECEQFACQSVCPVTDMASEVAYETCINDSLACTCYPESKAYETCQANLVGSPAAKCFPIASFAQGATTLAQIFCGGG
jgi:hypothetical protein